MNAAITSLVNGVAVDHVSIQDRGLLYGDGCFETIAIRQGRALLWDQHLQRLVDGCKRLGIDLDEIVVQLIAEMQSIVASANKAILKIIITRGTSERGYRSDPVQKPTRILSLMPWPKYTGDYRNDGIAMRVCDTRLSENKTLAGIKHLNRLEQVLARAEWQDQYQEGLMLNQAGQVIEGTMSNIFMETGDAVVTPALDGCGVAGVMRDVIMDKLSDENIIVQQRQIELQSLHQADAIFVCNSVIGLWPVTSITPLKNIIFPITKLQRKLQAAISDVCVTN